MTATVRGLNHAVLYVRDARRAAAFYSEAFGFEVLADYGEGAAVFMRAADTENHHDLGLFSHRPAGPPAGAGPGRAVPPRLAGRHDPRPRRDPRAAPARMGSLVGESDHGVTKSLYAKDPDGNEFEVMWMVPREQWGDMEHEAITKRLDLHAELAKHS